MLGLRWFRDRTTPGALARAHAISRATACRYLGERGFALLTGRWCTLQQITASPGKIGDIARAALVLTHFEHGYCCAG